MANNTIFDDTFRTMLEKMPELIIPVINEIFGTRYSMDTPIGQLRNEHQTKNGERITDSYFTIGKKQYHIECQSTDDSEMVIWMVEYDFAISLSDVEKRDGVYRIRFPHSAVLYLRNTKKESLHMEMEMPDGTVVNYHVPILCVQKYTKDEIFQKQLLFLLPFYILRYEKDKKKIDDDDKEMRKLLEEYESIEQQLENLLEQGREKVYRDLCELIEEIAEYIFAEEDSVKGGIGNIMGGKVLELKSDKIIREAREQGIQAFVEAYQEDEMSKDRVYLRLTEKFHLTEAEAQDYIKKFWKE